MKRKEIEEKSELISFDDLELDSNLTLNENLPSVYSSNIVLFNSDLENSVLDKFPEAQLETVKALRSTLLRLNEQLLNFTTIDQEVIIGLLQLKLEVGKFTGDITKIVSQAIEKQKEINSPKYS